MTIDLRKIPKVSQRKDSTIDQLKDLKRIANRLGMHEAIDVLENTINRISSEETKKNFRNGVILW